jgi:hypothetical protein
MIAAMEGLLPWIVLAIVVGLLGVALWLWRRRCRPGRGRADDPVASRLKFQGAQIGATSNRTYRKRTIDSVPVVRFRRDVDKKQLETDGADVTAELAEADEAKPPEQFRFEVRDNAVRYWTIDPKLSANLRFEECRDGTATEHAVTVLEKWFELEKHVVFFVHSSAPDSESEQGVWWVKSQDLLRRLTELQPQAGP